MVTRKSIQEYVQTAQIDNTMARAEQLAAVFLEGEINAVCEACNSPDGAALAAGIYQALLPSGKAEVFYTALLARLPHVERRW